jgi:hypothetical protein
LRHEYVIESAFIKANTKVYKSRSMPGSLEYKNFEPVRRNAIIRSSALVRRNNPAKIIHKKHKYINFLNQCAETPSVDLMRSCTKISSAEPVLRNYISGSSAFVRRNNLAPYIRAVRVLGNSNLFFSVCLLILLLLNIIFI